MARTAARTGVLLVATGDPSLEAVGEPTAPASGVGPGDVAVLRRRLLAIGGASPLAATAARIAEGLERRLNGLPALEPADPYAETLMPVPEGGARMPGDVPLPVAVALLGSRPSVEDAVAALRGLGVGRVVLLPLWPLRPPVEMEAATAALRGEAGAGLDVVEADVDLAGPNLLRFLADATQDAFEQVFPAHRPVGVFLAEGGADGPGGERYRERVESAAALLAEEVGMGAPDPDELAAVTGLTAFGGPGSAAPWLVAYAGTSHTGGGDWGPSLGEIIDAAERNGQGGVAVFPLGWAMDGLATLASLDIEAADDTLMRDMEFVRSRVPGDSDAMLEALETAVRREL